MRMFRHFFLSAAGLACGIVCGLGVHPAYAAPVRDASAETSGKAATAATRAANKAAVQDLDFNDRQDYADAQRGFMAPLPDNGRILDKTAVKPGISGNTRFWPRP